MSIFAFVKEFRFLGYPNCYGAAVYVRARNCRDAQIRWLSRPMTYHQAKEAARFFTLRRLRAGTMVTLPDGTVGMIASPFYADPETSEVVCVVQVKGGGPARVVAVEELRYAHVENAIKELTDTYGYRDITELVRRVQAQLDATETETENRPGGLDALCVLQGPEGNPIYCLNERGLLLELDEARTNGRYYRECPAPDPERNLWLILGDVESNEDEEEASI